MTKYIVTPRLSLRSVTENDAEILAKWKSQFNLREMSVGLHTIITKANQKRDIKVTLENGDLYIIIELKNTHMPIGYIRLGWLDKFHSKCWLSYGLGSNYNCGYCYEALERLFALLYKYDIIDIINAEVFEFNIASIKLLKKLGFQCIGERKNDYHYKGRDWSIYKFKLTKNDFIELKQKIS